MRVTVADFDDILINGVKFEKLIHLNFKDPFTEEERNHEDFSKFYRRIISEDDE